MKSVHSFAFLLSLLAVVCIGSRDPTIAIGEKCADIRVYWCIAKDELTDDQQLAVRIKYCNEDGVNCDAIKLGGPCYLPNTLYNHASYALDSYYAVKNNSCPREYGQYTAKNLSHGSCKFPETDKW